MHSAIVAFDSVICYNFILDYFAAARNDVNSKVVDWGFYPKHRKYLKQEKVGRGSEITDECLTRGASNEIHI